MSNIKTLPYKEMKEQDLPTLYEDKQHYDLSYADVELFKAVMDGNLPRIQKLFQPTFWRKAADANAWTYLGNPLVVAARYRRENTLDIMKCLIAHKIRIDTSNIHGQTALHIAVQNNDVECITYLISVNANVNAENEQDETPLIIAIQNGYYKIVEQLLQNGADIEHQNNKHQRPLQIAIDVCAHHYTKKNEDIDFQKVVKILVEHGANLNVRDERSGDTPLIEVASRGMLNEAKLLVGHGADINLPNKKSQTAIDLAKTPEIKSYLIKAGDNPSQYQTKIKENLLQQVSTMSTKELRKLPVANPELLEKLFAFGVVVEMYKHLTYTKQLSFYRITQNRLTPQEKDVVHSIIQTTQQHQRGLND